MRFFKILILVGVATLLNGCTVLGFATDMVIIHAIEDSVCEGSLNERLCRDEHNNDEVLFFTTEGLKQDTKIVKHVLDEIQESQPEILVEPEEIMPVLEKPKVVACKKVIDGQQQCYSADYYKDMYIASDSSLKK